MICDCCDKPATVEADGGHLCDGCDKLVQTMADIWNAGGSVTINVEEPPSAVTMWLLPEARNAR